MATGRGGSTERKLPERTCVGCQGKALKRDLVRVVRRPDGQVVLDPTGRVNGRGVYLHPSLECLQSAARTDRLSRSLEVPVPDEVVRRLEQSLLEGVEDLTPAELAARRRRGPKAPGPSGRRRPMNAAPRLEQGVPGEGGERR